MKLLREVSDKESGNVLKLALNSQNRLQDLKNFDTMLDELTFSKKDNPDFGDILTTGKHTIELRKKGKYLLYANA